MSWFCGSGVGQDFTWDSLNIVKISIGSKTFKLLFKTFIFLETIVTLQKKSYLLFFLQKFLILVCAVLNLLQPGTKGV